MTAIQILTLEHRNDERIANAVAKKEMLLVGDVIVRTVTGSRINCNVTTVEGLPGSTGLNSS